MSEQSAEAAYWDGRYAVDGRLWGEGPSELARLAVTRLRPYGCPGLIVLDAGCGSGRDSRYLAAELRCRVLGLDPSPRAIAVASGEPATGLDVEFQTGQAGWLAVEDEHAGGYDVVYSCNVYHLMGSRERRSYATALAALARPGGLLFLSTLSPRDPQHYAVGKRVPGEERSWFEHVYLHFCTAEELADDFAAFEILDIEERSYLERNVNGVTHRHAGWFLEGRRKAE